MTLSFILNGEDQELFSDPQRNLLFLLQKEYGLFKEVACCGQGRCGRCSLLLNGRLVPACQVPFFRLRDAELITPEGFAQTGDFRDLWEAFCATGSAPCLQCWEAQAFALHSALELQPQLDEAALFRLVSEIPCRCGTAEALVAGAQTWQRLKEGRRVGRR